MKIFRRTVALFLILTFLVALSAMAVSGSGAYDPDAQNQSSTAQPSTSDGRNSKVVSVLYDNSKSMKSFKRQAYALYSLQMLASLLDAERDTLVITPMNCGTGADPINRDMENSITVNLKAPNLEEEIARVLSDPKLRLTGNTPESPLELAVNWLEENGLKDSDNLVYAEEGLEHWLVILTDGSFDHTIKEQTPAWTDWDSWKSLTDEERTNQAVEHYISDFPSLRTIYISFGGGVDMTKDSYLQDKYSFTPYFAASSDGLVKQLCGLSNQISGRYSLDEDDFAVSGSTVTVDLNKIPFSLRSISIIAQNCGATISGVTYNGAAVTDSSMSQKNTINTEVVDAAIDADTTIPKDEKEIQKLKMKNGYSAVINGSPTFSGGTLVIEFSGTVDKDNVTIMAEPALNIVPIVEYQKKNDTTTWTPIDADEAAQYINEHLTEGDKLRINYKVVSQNGAEVDINAIFDDVDVSITYARGSHETNQAIPLVIGNNEIAITVSVMGGTYKMYASIRCIVEANPEAYKVDAQCNGATTYFDPSMEIVYTVFSDNMPVGKDELESRYTWEIQLYDPDGKSFYKYPYDSASGEPDPEYIKNVEIDGHGKIKVTVSPKLDVYGENYTVVFKVFSEYGISRTKKIEFDYVKPSITVDVSGTEEVKHSNTDATVTFTVKADGTPLTKEQVDKFDLSTTVTGPDGSEIGAAETVGADGRISYSFSIDKNLYGKCRVEFGISDENGVGGSAEHVVKYYPDKTGGSFKIEIDAPTSLPASSVTFPVKVKVIADGRQLDKDDLENYVWTLVGNGPEGQIEFDTQVASDGTVTADVDLTGAQFGAYKFNFVISFSDDYSERAECSVAFKPTSLELLVIDGDISLSEHQLTINERPITFGLKLDGRNSSFANELFSYTLKVGGVDVTAYTTLGESTLTYIPRAEHLGAMASIGQRTVTLTVTWNPALDLSDLNDSESVTLSITDVVYLIEWIGGSSRPVDRFDIKDSAAELRFRILRDGVPMPKSELQTALKDKTLSIKDKKGTFTKQLWLPTGANVSIEGDGDDTVVVYKVVNDIPVVGTFLAMLIFNGDKPIEVSFRGQNETGEFTFAPSGIFEYVWRILVILFVLYLALYVIGFFNGKCKSVKEGTLLCIKFGVRGAAPVEIRASSFTKMNFSFWKKYRWHVWRFLPVRFFCFGNKEQMRFWYHQPALEGKGGFSIGLTKNGKTCIKCSKDFIKLAKGGIGTPAYTELNNLCTKLKTYNGKFPGFDNPPKNDDLRAVLALPADPESHIIPKNTAVTIGDGDFFARVKIDKIKHKVVIVGGVFTYVGHKGRK